MDSVREAAHNNAYFLCVDTLYTVQLFEALASVLETYELATFSKFRTVQNRYYCTYSMARNFQMSI